MSLVETQPAMLPAFGVSDTRPGHTSSYLEHAHSAPLYTDSRHSSKENKTPPPTTDNNDFSPRSVKSIDRLNHSSPGHAQHLSPNAVTGKKRSADGEVKPSAVTTSEQPKAASISHSRSNSNVSCGSNANMVELSQQLRTRLTYAMVKVQNGWQNRSLEEVESLASASPRSTTFNYYSNNQHLLSPRVAMTAHLNREASESSSSSEKTISQTRSAPALMSPPPARKGLAPPANIVARPGMQRRRPTPNAQPGHTPTRPSINQRTPSQNAAMEADAVETLLFMASPNNSGKSHRTGQFSPVTSAPSVHRIPAPTSPLRNTFSAPTSPRRARFSSSSSTRPGTDKNSILASMIEKLDEDGSAELDEALSLIDRHHATKMHG